MRIFSRAFCALFLVAVSVSPAGAQSLTLDSVVELSKSGLGDDAIIAKIKSDKVRFELSVDQMIDLKQKGVSSQVISALMTRTDEKPKLSLDSPDPMVAHPTGVYMLTGTGDQAKMIKMNPTVSNQAKTGGLLGYALTSGLASMSVKAAIPNAKAKVTTSPRPTFYFFFDQANDLDSTNTWASGSNISVTSPAEFTLIELMQKKDRREARVGSMNIGGAKTGVMDKDRIAFDYTEVRPGVYKVEAANVQKAGEFGFIFALAGTGSNGAMTARIFDFSVQ